MWKHIVIAMVASLIVSQATIAESLSSSGLLDKYQATQEGLKAFIAESEEVTMLNDPAYPKRFTREVAEFRTDGNRVHYLTYLWYDIDVEAKPLVTEETRYKSFLWDDDSFYEYRKGLTLSDNRAFVKRHDGMKNEMVSIAYGGAPLMGVLSGDFEPVGSILSQANTILVRSEMERIGQSECYVIDAETGSGKYSVWLDPQHGYNIVKANVIKKADDLAWGRSLGWESGKTWFSPDSNKKHATSVRKEFTFSMENVRFDEINDIWVPIEADFQETHTYKDGRIATVKRTHKRTKVDLNPDFDGMGAFVPNIPNETKVYLEGVSGIEYKWFDGKLFADVETLVMDQIDGEVEKLFKERGQAHSTTSVPTCAVIPEAKEDVLVQPPIVEEPSPSVQVLADTSVTQATVANPRSSLWRYILIAAAVLIVAVLILRARRGNKNVAA